MDLRRAAVSLQKAVAEKFGVKPRIRTGSPGDLTLLVNGANVFHYKKEGSLPGMDVLLQRMSRVLALLGPREMSDLSPQSGPERTLIRSLSRIALPLSCRQKSPPPARRRRGKSPRSAIQEFTANS